MVDLQVSSPWQLHLRKIVHTDKASLEFRLHSIFSSLRMRGEWFRAHPTLAELADAVPDPDIPSDAPLDATESVSLGLRSAGQQAAVAGELMNVQIDEIRAREAANDPETWTFGRWPLTALPDDMAPMDEWVHSTSDLPSVR